MAIGIPGVKLQGLVKSCFRLGQTLEALQNNTQVEMIISPTRSETQSQSGLTFRLVPVPQIFESERQIIVISRPLWINLNGLPVTVHRLLEFSRRLKLNALPVQLPGRFLGRKSAGDLGPVLGRHRAAKTKEAHQYKQVKNEIRGTPHLLFVTAKHL